MPMPARDTIQTHRDDRRNADQRMQTCCERIRTAEQELASTSQGVMRGFAHNEDAVAPRDDCRRAQEFAIPVGR